MKMTKHTSVRAQQRAISPQVIDWLGEPAGTILTVPLFTISITKLGGSWRNAMDVTA